MAEALKRRAQNAAVQVVQLFRELPVSGEGRVLGGQVLRAGTSVAANYRAACRARSKREFIAKLGLVIEEADETIFWLEMLVEVNLVEATRVGALTREFNELLAIFVVSRHTARHRMKQGKT